jgi:DNA-binding NarL/FixJ family response regulator
VVKVALVDAHTVMRDGLHALIGREPGLTVAGSFDEGSDLIDALREVAPDVVIMEAQFPDGNGADWTRQVKRVRPEVRVVILTGSHADAELLLALEAGADAFLYKEDPAERLMVAIREVIKGNMYVSPLAARRMRDFALNGAEDALSPRELEVLVALHDGLSTDEVARKLRISDSTVKTHITGIYRKLDAHNRVSASREAERRGILPSD